MAVITRTAGSPTSWGARLVPDGGYQMRPERVLDEMWEVGLIATELGPAGYLPLENERSSQLLDAFCLKAVGGIIYSGLYDSQRDPGTRAGEHLGFLRRCGGLDGRPLHF